MIHTDDQISENVVPNAFADLRGHLGEQRRNGCVVNLQFFLARRRGVEVQKSGRAFPVVFLCACAGRHRGSVDCGVREFRYIRLAR